MKYRLKKDLLWLKAEEILPNENSVLKPNFRCLYTIYRDNKARYTESMEICPEEYPDFFEPISEEDEKLEEAKKLLESNGWKVRKQCCKNPNPWNVWVNGVFEYGYCRNCGIK